MTPAASRAGAAIAKRPEAIEWRLSERPVAYPAALAAMEERVAAIRAGRARELCWLLEHPPLYTAGTSARTADLLAPNRLPVFSAGRGGQYTYHGPGQRVAYLMLDLQRRGPDLRAYIWRLEEWVIRTLERFRLRGERRPGRVGIWVIKSDGAEAKIAAIGVRIRRWVTYHGVAINLDPDLGHFSGIVPCGIKGFGVTSFADLGLTTSMAELDGALISTFDAVFDGASQRHFETNSVAAVPSPQTGRSSIAAFRSSATGENRERRARQRAPR